MIWRALRQRRIEAQLALVFFTRLPIPRLGAPLPELRAAVWALPLVGAVIGACAAASAAFALAMGLPAGLAAGLALTVQIAVTGALHEDGLADVCDGFWGASTPERRLQIMRDSHIGSYGTIGLILSLGLRWLALAALLEAGPKAAAVLVFLAMASRSGPLIAMALLPPARSDGLGRSATKPPLAVVIGGLALALGPLLVIEGGLLAATISCLSLGLFLNIAKAKIGGQTGDVLGASQQLSEIALLLVFAAR